MKSKTMRLFLLAFLLCYSLVVHAAPVIPMSHSKELPISGGSMPISIPASNGAMATNAILHPPEIKAIVTRVLEASLAHSDKGTNTMVNVKSLARTLSAFQPTLVSGLVTLSNEGFLHPFEKEAFLTVRKEVLTANPHCKFDVVINGSSFSTAPALINKLQEVNAKLGPDVLHIIIPVSNEVVYPSVLARGIEFAHAHGMLVSYEGPLSMIPDGVDIAILPTASGDIHREEINNFKTRHPLPLVVQLSSNSQRTNHHTASLVTRLAEDQASLGYHLAYPINDFQTTSPAKGSPQDASLLVRLRALMTRYN